MEKEKKKPVLYIVVPCYNEEACIQETSKRLREKMKDLIADNKIAKSSRVVLVDDGSKDKTWELIEALPKRFIGLKLAHNVGHQNALLAGLMYARGKCDISISMDADLQDDINAVDGFIEKYNEGCEIVYGVRSERKTDTWFKRNTALGFYKMMNFLGVEVVYNCADYRLIGSQALEALSEYGEVNLFLRGIVPKLGYKTGIVTYARAERFAGESKYPLKKMLNFAWDGVTSFSVKPIRAVLGFGVVVFFVSLLIMLYSLIVKLVGNAVSGWTFTICSIWLLGGIQMISIGLIGEYIGKTYMETKHRPRYCIEKVSKNEE